MRSNALYLGDNLNVLREYIPDESVDLIYLDPPFNSRRSYHFIRSRAGGSATHSQAFDDTWHWTPAAEETLREIEATAQPHVAEMMRAIISFVGRNDLAAYLVMMIVRLIELHRALAPTGSIYLHCDPTASHYLKVAMDAVLGGERFVNEIVWRRMDQHNDVRRKFADVSDTILLYSKSDEYCFHIQYAPYSEEYVESAYRYVDEEGRRYRLRDLRSPNPRPNLTYEYKGYVPHPNGWSISLERMREYDARGLLAFPKIKSGRIRLRRYLDEMPGVPVGNIWADIKSIKASSAERVGYPTQKPEALLERIILASSNEGDTVLDPFCGCGTTLAVAQRLGRRWVGIDSAPLAIELTRRRLRDAFGVGVEYEVRDV